MPSIENADLTPPTANRPIRQGENVSPRQSLTSWGVPLLVGLAIGGALGGPLTFMALEELEQPAEALVRLAVPIFIMAAVLLAIGTPIAYLLLRRLLKHAHGTLNLMLTSAIQAGAAAGEKRYVDAAVAGERMIAEAAAWYARISLRRWLMSSAIALILAFGGVLTAGLLFRQIVLLKEQNQKLEVQAKLMDLQTLAARSDQSRQLYVDYTNVARVVAEIQAAISVYKSARNLSFEVTGRAQKVNRDVPFKFTEIISVSNFDIDFCNSSFPLPLRSEGWNEVECKKSSIFPLTSQIRFSSFEKTIYSSVFLAQIYYLQKLALNHEDALDPSRSLSRERVLKRYLPNILVDAASACRLEPDDARQAMNLAVNMRAIESAAQQLAWFFQFGYADDKFENGDSLHEAFRGAESGFLLSVPQPIQKRSSEFQNVTISVVGESITAILRDLVDRVDRIVTSCEEVKNNYRLLLDTLDPLKVVSPAKNL